MANNNKAHKTEQPKQTVWVLRVYTELESGSDADGGCFAFKGKPTVEDIYNAAFKETCEELQADDDENDYKADYQKIARKLLAKRSYSDAFAEQAYVLEEISLR